MKTISILSVMLFTLYVSAQQAERTLEKTLEAESNTFQVTVEKDARTVEVVSVNDAPSHMKFRILRKDKEPLEFHLKAIQAPNQPTRFAGKIDRWNDSYIGMELVFSFDRKTWKRISQKFH